MEVTPQKQYNCCIPQVQQPVVQPKCCQTPVSQPPMQQPQQTYQIPASTSGVNIQIFNPAVTAPGAQAPTYNVNSPCYPSNYYTNQYGQNGNTNEGTNKKTVEGNGAGNGSGNIETGGNHEKSGNISPENNMGKTNSKDDINNKEQNGNNNNDTTDKQSMTTGNTSSSTETTSSKKTEKKQIIQLTDEYIMNLENYLNSQDKNIRLHAANEVYDRLEEDSSRKDDSALTALVNKMLQDPSPEIRVIALSALEGRLVMGDKTTAGLLKEMQTKSDAYGQDAIDASKILLQMSSKPVEKEVEIDPMRRTKVQKTIVESEKKENKKEQ